MWRTRTNENCYKKPTVGPQMSDVGPGAPCLRVHNHHSRVKKSCWDEYGAREERCEREIRTWSRQTVDQTTPWLWEPTRGACQELTRRGAFSRNLWRQCQDPGPWHPVVRPGWWWWSRWWWWQTGVTSNTFIIDSCLGQGYPSVLRV